MNGTAKALFSLGAFLFHAVAATNGEEKTGDSRINELLQLVDRHYLQQREATFYADQLNNSVKHLNALVKRKRGARVKEWVLQRLIL
ncbi:hypothetical protein ACFSRY_18850 [Pontibacter locisalis]|uniref:Uncharacterized protein n=1 Tax=Pontibacter locisalis TaxID=1719035 RepID=A0ABW5IR62_9BACT